MLNNNTKKSYLQMQEIYKIRPFTEKVSNILGSCKTSNMNIPFYKRLFTGLDKPLALKFSNLFLSVRKNSNNLNEKSLHRWQPFYIFIFIFIWSFLSIIWLLSLNIKADDFYNTGGDIMDCKLDLATCITYSNLPTLSNDIENGFYYDPTEVSGQTKNFIPTHTFFDVATNKLPNPHRYKDVASEIVVPPNTEVNFGLFYLNLSGHSIYSNESYLFVNSVYKLLDNPSIKSGSKSFYYNGQTNTKTGQYYTIDPINFNPNTRDNPPYGTEILSAKTIQPMQFVSQNIKNEFIAGNKMTITLFITLKNISVYNLSNINVKANLINDSNNSTETVNQLVNFNTGEEKTINLSWTISEYEAGKNITVSSVEVSDPNTHRECANTGDTYGNSHNGNSRTFITSRSDDNAKANWFALQPDFASSPIDDFFCINLIPYKFWTSPQIINIQPRLEVKKSADKTLLEYEDILTYKIEVKNLGITIKNVKITDILPFNWKHSFEIVDLNGGILKVELNKGIPVSYIEWNIPVLDTKQTLNLYVKFKIINQNIGTITSLENNVIVSKNNKDLTTDKTTIRIGNKIQTNVLNQPKSNSCFIQTIPSGYNIPINTVNPINTATASQTVTATTTNTVTPSQSASATATATASTSSTISPTNTITPVPNPILDNNGSITFILNNSIDCTKENCTQQNFEIQTQNLKKFSIPKIDFNIILTDDLKSCIQNISILNKDLKNIFYTNNLINWNLLNLQNTDNTQISIVFNKSCENKILQANITNINENFKLETKLGIVNICHEPLNTITPINSQVNTPTNTQTSQNTASGHGEYNQTNTITNGNQNNNNSNNSQTNDTLKLNGFAKTGISLNKIIALFIFSIFILNFIIFVFKFNTKKGKRM